MYAILKLLFAYFADQRWMVLHNMGAHLLNHDSECGAKIKMEQIKHFLCITCQGKDTKNVLNVPPESLTVLHTAMEGRCDETAERLQTIAKHDNWLHYKTPKWHTNCRSRYLLKECQHCQKKGGWEMSSKITTKNREQKIKAKPWQLNHQDVLVGISGKGHDMVCNGICYHKHCMDVSNNTRVLKGKSEINKLYD